MEVVHDKLTGHYYTMVDGQKRRISRTQALQKGGAPKAGAGAAGAGEEEEDDEFFNWLLTDRIDGNVYSYGTRGHTDKDPLALFQRDDLPMSVDNDWFEVADVTPNKVAERCAAVRDDLSDDQLEALQVWGPNSTLAVNYTTSREPYQHENRRVRDSVILSNGKAYKPYQLAGINYQKRFIKPAFMNAYKHCVTKDLAVVEREKCANIAASRGLKTETDFDRELEEHPEKAAELNRCKAIGLHLDQTESQVFYGENNDEVESVKKMYHLHNKGHGDCLFVAMTHSRYIQEQIERGQRPLDLLIDRHGMNSGITNQLDSKITDWAQELRDLACDWLLAHQEQVSVACLESLLSEPAGINSQIGQIVELFNSEAGELPDLTGAPLRLKPDKLKRQIYIDLKQIDNYRNAQHTDNAEQKRAYARTLQTVAELALPVYLERMRNTYTFGSELEINALAQALNVRIQVFVIYDMGYDKVSPLTPHASYGSAGAERTFNILNYNQRHYELLWPMVLPEYGPVRFRSGWETGLRQLYSQYTDEPVGEDLVESSVQLIDNMEPVRVANYRVDLNYVRSSTLTDAAAMEQYDQIMVAINRRAPARRPVIRPRRAAIEDVTSVGKRLRPVMMDLVDMSYEAIMKEIGQLLRLEFYNKDPRHDREHFYQIIFQLGNFKLDVPEIGKLKHLLTVLADKPKSKLVFLSLYEIIKKYHITDEDDRETLDVLLQNEESMIPVEFNFEAAVHSAFDGIELPIRFDHAKSYRQLVEELVRANLEYFKLYGEGNYNPIDTNSGKDITFVTDWYPDPDSFEGELGVQTLVEVVMTDFLRHPYPATITIISFIDDRIKAPTNPEQLAEVMIYNRVYELLDQSQKNLMLGELVGPLTSLLVIHARQASTMSFSQEDFYQYVTERLVENLDQSQEDLEALIEAYLIDIPERYQFTIGAEEDGATAMDTTADQEIGPTTADQERGDALAWMDDGAKVKPIGPVGELMDMFDLEQTEAKALLAQHGTMEAAINARLAEPAQEEPTVSDEYETAPIDTVLPLRRSGRLAKPVPAEADVETLTSMLGVNRDKAIELLKKSASLDDAVNLHFASMDASM